MRNIRRMMTTAIRMYAQTGKTLSSFDVVVVVLRSARPDPAPRTSCSVTFRNTSLELAVVVGHCPVIFRPVVFNGVDGVVALPRLDMLSSRSLENSDSRRRWLALWHWQKKCCRELNSIHFSRSPFDGLFCSENTKKRMVEFYFC